MSFFLLAAFALHSNVRPSSLSAKSSFIGNAAKEKEQKSFAPHLYQQKVFIANAAKEKEQKSFAPFIFIFDHASLWRASREGA